MKTWKQLLVGSALIISSVSAVTADTGTGAVPGAPVPLFSTENRFSSDDSSESGEHRYRVRVEAGRLIEVIIRSEAVDTYVEAVLPNGERVTNDDYEGLNAGFVRMMPATGELTVEASPLFDEGQGVYQVLVREVGDAEEVTIGEPITASLTKSDAVTGDGTDRYWFQGSAGQIVVIDVRSDDVDPYLRVQDDQGREFVDDDGGTGRNSRVSYAFDRDGILTISASSFSGDEVGSYELHLREIGDDAPVASYQGELSSAGNRAYDGKLMERHEYAGTAGETLSIHLESRSFDTQLYVSGPSGENIAHDDDGGGGTNSLVTVTLPETGTYVLYVLSFLDGSGPYRLSVYR
ncbi:MAG: PPC domain-containing protein [Alkalispirochaeta sp.]